MSLFSVLKQQFIDKKRTHLGLSTPHHSDLEVHVPSVPDDNQEMELDSIHIDVRVYPPGYVVWTLSEPVNLHRVTERFIHHNLVPKPENISVQVADQPLDAEILSFNNNNDNSTQLQLLHPHFHGISAHAARQIRATYRKQALPLTWKLMHTIWSDTRHRLEPVLNQPHWSHVSDHTPAEWMRTANNIPKCIRNAHSNIAQHPNLSRHWHLVIHYDTIDQAVDSIHNALKRIQHIVPGVEMIEFDSVVFNASDNPRLPVPLWNRNEPDADSEIFNGTQSVAIRKQFWEDNFVAELPSRFRLWSTGYMFEHSAAA